MLLAAVQTGPVDGQPADIVTRSFELVTAMERVPDLVVLPELFSLPFWCVGLSDPSFFGWAEERDGVTIQGAAKWAKELGCYVVVPFFEKGALAGEYYNSAAVLGPDGELVPGLLPDGSSVSTYRKNAISSYQWDQSRNDEKYYFRPGPGFPVFHTEIGILGILICYDRWFAEGWRVLALQGAEIICIPTTSSSAASELFIPSIRTWANQNVVYAVVANRAGTEEVRETSTTYFGKSCIASPRGELLASADPGAAAVAIMADADRAEIQRARQDLTMYRDRRPELYRLIGER